MSIGIKNPTKHEQRMTIPTKHGRALSSTTAAICLAGIVYAPNQAS